MENGLNNPHPAEIPNPAGINVLLIDDSQADRELVRTQLLRDPNQAFCVTEAQSGPEALILTADQDFDCAIVDYRMPGMDGLEVLAHLRNKRSTRDLPVILLSGVGSEVTVLEAMRAGVADYIPKTVISEAPIHEAVVDIVGKAREKARRARETETLEATNIGLQQQHAEIQRVYHTISHEIKTPLTAAREFAALVMDEVHGPLGQEQKECMQQIINCCDQLATQFNDLLDFARANAGQLTLDTEESEILPLIRRATAAHIAAAREKNLTINRAVDPDLPRAMLDADRVVQMLGGLLDNAVKFTEPGGMVEITAQPVKSPAEGVQINVSDNGCGIAQENLTRVFDSLYQVAPGGPAAKSGLGLGLGIARDIARLHGGDISVVSKLDVGTTFTVFLPCRPANGSHNTRHAVPVLEGV